MAESVIPIIDIKGVTKTFELQGETIVALKPQAEWPDGLPTAALTAELDQRTPLHGLQGM